MKKIVGLLLALTLVLSACSAKTGDVEGKDGEEKLAIHKGPIDKQFAGKTLKIMSFTKDLEYAAKAFEEAYDCKVELTVVEQDALGGELAKMASGEANADVYTIEADTMKKWLDMEALQPLTEVSAENYAPYATAYATDKSGQLRALTWSATPVNLYYRRTMAKAVLGEDTPEVVGASVANLSALVETAGKMHAGGYKMFSNREDMRAFYAPLDKAERAVISPEELAFLNTVKQMETEYRLAGLQQWSTDWFKGMYGMASNPITGKNLEVFGYVMPSWGKTYILEKAGDSSENAEALQNPTWGDWGVAILPTASFADGIWLGIGKNSKEAEMAKAFLVYVTQNQAFLEKWLERTKELPAFLPVLESYQTEMEDSFLGGQKGMPLYIETIKAIPAKSAWQIAEEKAYYAVLEDYLQGKLATIEELQAKLAVTPESETPIEQPVEKPAAQ